MNPPAAPRIPKLLEKHGETRQDDYYWLRERTNPQVIQYLEAENAYTAQIMQPAEALRAQIYAEILGRIKQTDLEVPVKRGDYFYYSRTEEGKQYPIYCRNRAGAAEEILLDANALAAGQPYFSLGAFVVSEDHRLLAYSVDNTGAEEFTVHVKDLQTAALLPDEIPLTSAGAVWANDNRTLFYATFDETKRPEKVRRHVLGTPPADDPVVFTESDTRFTFELSKTRSRKYILITSVNASKTSEVLYLDADDPATPFRIFQPRQHGVEYYLEHQGDSFLVRTNEGGATNFKLLRHPSGETIWPAHDDATLEEADAFADYLVLSTREHGLPCLRVHPNSYLIDFPEPAYAVHLQGNAEYATSQVRFQYTSLVTPKSVYDFNMLTRTRELKKRTEILGGYDPSQYVSERIYAAAPDGKRVPISLVYKRGLVRDGRNPALLTGYGSYGINKDPEFSVPYLSLLDRGFIVAIGHIRGGSEYGRTWFEDGRMLKKCNSFSDFIACAEHLIAEQYTSPSKLAAIGGSAGGLLMGAVINMRPDLFHTVVAHVPFVDVVTTMLDASIPLTTGEYDQWGNPEEKAFYDCMRAYSPYDNVRAQAYPNLLITTGLNDPRVAYWEPAKWAARLRALKTDNNLLLLKTEMGAGHGGPSGRYERFKETAFAYAFILMTLSQEAPSNPY